MSRSIKASSKFFLLRLKNAYNSNPGLVRFAKILFLYIARRVNARANSYRNKSIFSPIGVKANGPLFTSIQHRFIHGGSMGSRIGVPALELLTLFSQKIYVLVGATVASHSNTGVQKVVKSTLEALVEKKFDIVFVRVDLESRRLIKLNEAEINELVQNSQLDCEKLIANSKRDQNDYPSNAMLFVPEVPYVSSSDPLMSDVLLAYCNSFGLIPSAIYYDSIPLFSQGYAYGIEAHLSYLRFLSSCLVITCISESSERELRNLFQQSIHTVSKSRPKVFTQHLPMPKSFTNLVPSAISSLIEKKFVLTVGSVEPRKNQITSIKAFIELENEIEDLPILVIAGGIRPDVLHWQNESKGHNIVWLGNVTDEEMVWLYQNCQFTIFISKNEGFGYPVLESAYFGKLCITSAAGSMGEIARNKPFTLLQNVEDTSELKIGIRGILESLFGYESSSVPTFFEDGGNWDTYIEDFLKKVRESTVRSMDSIEILYWIDHTSSFAGNSGIQRVVRGLAYTLLTHEVSLTPVVWDSKVANFQLANREELINLSKWSGPDLALWNLDFNLKPKSGVSRILIIPELTTYSPNEHFLREILMKAKSLEMITSVVFFDALPVRMQDIYPPEAGLKHGTYMNDLSKADSILAISDSARNDLIEHFLGNKHMDSSLITKVFTVPLPSLFIGDALVNQGDHKFDANRDQKVRVLCVGTLEARKNYINLIKAFESVVEDLPAESIELIIVGKGVDSKIVDYVEDASRRLPVQWFGHVSDESLKEYYKFCDFTVFPSLGEGFGLPLTESLSFGKPVLCGTGGALEDNASSGGCLIVNVRDSEAIAAGIIQLATDPELLSRLKVEISDRKFMSWGDYAASVLGITLQSQRKSV